MKSKAKKATPAKKGIMETVDEKVFFVIKFWLMSIFQGLAIVIVVTLLGAINAIQLIILGIILFVISLIISRRFDKNITALAVFIGKRLAKYPKIEKLLLKSI